MIAIDNLSSLSFNGLLVYLEYFKVKLYVFYMNQYII